MSIATKIYFSREDRIADIADPNERAQYDDPDIDKEHALDPLYGTSEALEHLEANIFAYFDEIKEGHPPAIKHSREQLVYDWAIAQASLSKIAWILRIDGNEALQRLVEAVKNNRTVDMEGL